MIYKKISSKNYGEYNVELIGYFSFKTLYLDGYENACKWLSKHHFKKAFASFEINRCNEMENPEYDTYSIWVCTERSNKNWDYSQWHNNHPTKKLSKKLPIMSSDTIVQNWLATSSKYIKEIYND